jgi:hypothetical protein
MVKSDFSTARTCFEQHLQLVQTLMDAEAETTAWIVVSIYAYIHAYRTNSIHAYIHTFIFMNMKTL